MSARISDIGGDIWPFLIIGGESEGQSSMVHGEKERGGGDGRELSFLTA